ETMPSKPYAETSVKSAAPTQTTRWVRSPACRSRSSRSRPIAPPSAAATKRRNSTSGQPMEATARTLGKLTRDRLRLEGCDLADTRRSESEQLVEGLACERVTLGRRLHLDEASVTGHHHVHVRVRARVLGVVEVEQRHTVH